MGKAVKGARRKEDGVREEAREAGGWAEEREIRRTTKIMMARIMGTMRSMRAEITKRMTKVRRRFQTKLLIF